MIGAVGGVLRVLFQRYSLDARIARSEAAGWAHASTATNPAARSASGDDAVLPLNPTRK